MHPVEIERKDVDGLFARSRNIDCKISGAVHSPLRNSYLAIYSIVN